MRWGLLAVVAAVLNAFTPACDTPKNDAAPRYYIPPDASDDDPNQGPGGSTPIVLADGGLAEPHDGDAAGNAIPSDAGLGLALSGWWRAPFSAAPWVGTTSLGASATQNLGTGTAPPTAGALLNGMATADFNGTTSWLTGALVNTFLSPSAFSGWALVNVDTIHTNDPTWFLNDAIACTSGSSQFGVYLRDDGAATVTVGLGLFSTSQRTVSTTFVKNTWQLVQWRSNGVTMSIRVNGGTWASTDTGAGSFNYALEVGRAPGQVQFLDGRIADLGLSTATLADLDFDAIRAYAGARYALTL